MKVVEVKRFYNSILNQVASYIDGLTEVIKGNTVSYDIRNNCEKIGTVTDLNDCNFDIYTLGEINKEAAIDAAKKLAK